MKMQTYRKLGLALLGSTLLTQSLLAGPVFEESFAPGASRTWEEESGKVRGTSSEEGHLLLFSLKESEDQFAPGVAAFTISHLQKNTDYVVKVKFRFEKNFPDTWPWAALEVWSPGSKWDDAPDDRLGITKVSSRKDKDNGAWQDLTLRFNSEDNTSVIVRLRNNPKMLDQSHWDDLVVEQAAE